MHMEANEWLVVLTGGALLLNLVITVGGGAWALSRHTAAQKEAIQGELDAMRTAFHEETMMLSRNVGETVAAVRTKITDVEMWTRDEFVRREDFYRILDGITKSIGSLDNKVDSRIDNLGLKIDNLSNNVISRLAASETVPRSAG